MTQYDDFGRPIYETAEEYNRANKARKMTYAYTNPDGDVYETSKVTPEKRSQTAAQRHAMRAGSKNAKKLIVGLVVFAIAINLGIVFTILSSVGFFSGGSYEENIEDWISFEDDEGYEEYLGDDTTPLLEGFETFTYNGETITLPTTFEELSSMKFVLDTEYSKFELVPSGFNEFIDLVDADGNTYAMVIVDNYTEDEIPLGKCTIDYFSISNPYLYDETESAPEFMFVNGLTFESTYGDLEATLGVPYYHYEDHSEEGYYYDSYEWTYYGEYETHNVIVTFWNGEISDISIQKNVIE